METQKNYPKNTPRDINHHADHAGTNPDRYSEKSMKQFKKEVKNKKSIIMNNKKVIIGVAAGVAALAVAAIILKRKGYLDGLTEKAEELGGKIKDKYASFKETAGKKLDEAVQKGTEIADKMHSKAEAAANTSA